MFEDIFRKRKLNAERLTRYGFEPKDSGWSYTTAIMDNAYTLHVLVAENGDVDTELAEAETGEPYTLYKTTASGVFIGKVRTEIENVLKDIAKECFDLYVFRSEQTLKLIDHVRDTYGDEPEFLWQNFPDNAIWRRKDSQKWYGVILTVPKSKLGAASNEIVEILDLHLSPEQMTSTVDNKLYFPGWHMNKKSWYTVILNGSIPTDEICLRIAESYKLAKP